MPPRSVIRKVRRKSSRRRRSRWSLLKRVWPSARLRRRWWRAFRRAHGGLQICLALGIAAVLFLTVNWVYQVFHKPSELFFPVSGTLYKSPSETWSVYGSLFRRYSTDVMTPELLAALAQVEGSGNPIVRTYWRWSWRPHPFELYRPASSAVGMYQLTDGTFAEAKHYCIHDHRVVEDGPWDDWHTCWFNGLYMRVIPSDAIEMTSAYLDRAVTETLLAHHVHRATLQQKQDLAAVIHLCGAGAGDLYVRRGLRLTVGQKCGDHEARVYVRRVDEMKRLFALMAAGG
ncbi:MAG: lytic transglycosylase domain-containing protein [Gammaproteobacteria bacterium]|nr:lytic transglycosylase domain-containing protein [Gammaproteobacteria bacterium]